MAVEVLVYCDENWGKHGNAHAAYNAKKMVINASHDTIPNKIDRLDILEYKYNARIKTGDLVSCRPADQGIGWNKKRRVLVRIENVSLEQMQIYVNDSYGVPVSFLGKSGDITKFKRRYCFTFTPMIAGTVYKFQNIKDVKMIDKTGNGHFTKVIR